MGRLLKKEAVRKNDRWIDKQMDNYKDRQIDR